MHIRLDGKLAIVTDANSGIGKVIALALAGAGAMVCITYMSHPEIATKMVDEIVAKDGTALAIAIYIAAVGAMFAQLYGTWDGRLSRLRTERLNGSYGVQCGLFSLRFLRRRGCLMQRVQVHRMPIRNRPNR